MLLRRISLIFFLLLTVTGGYAQKAVVSGIIRDEQQSPVNQALIADEATGFGVYTDCTGMYSIEVPAGKNITLIYYANGFAVRRMQFLLAPNYTRTADVQLNKIAEQNGLITASTSEYRREEAGNTGMVEMIKVVGVEK